MHVIQQYILENDNYTVWENKNNEIWPNITDINLSAQSKDTAYNNRKFNYLTVKRKVTFAYQLSNKDDIYFAYDLSL